MAQEILVSDLEDGKYTGIDDGINIEPLFTKKLKCWDHICLTAG